MDNQNLETITIEPGINENTVIPGYAGPVKVSRVILNALKILGEKNLVILWSSFILLILWGLKGNPAAIFPEAWRMALFPYLAWRDQLISYVMGFILVVAVPVGIIKFYFKEPLSNYGLTWPKDKLKPGLIALLVLIIGALPLFYVGTSNSEIQNEYPCFGKYESGHPLEGQFKIRTWGEFIIYELVYFLFFISIEFMFRGYLLLGFYRNEERGVGDRPGISQDIDFWGYAIIIQMLVYTSWHLAKPTIEYTGAFFWGAVVTVTALILRSVWPIIIAHWVLNAFMDTVLWLKH